MTFPCKIKVIADRDNTTDLEIQLIEGRKRQIKKMFRKLGHSVLGIKRISFGPLKLANLKVGLWRVLKTCEITELKRSVGIT